MKQITVSPNQTLLDIAMQYYGNIEVLGKLLADNPTLNNDPAALAAEGYAAGDFYPNLPLRPGMLIAIDDQSRLPRPNVIRKITREVTTYMTPQWQEQLNR